MVSSYPSEFLLFTFLLGFYFPTNYAQTENTTQPEVTIPQGTLLGISITTRNNRNISGFLGIPYGQPPTGNLRFANPVAASGWNGTLNASVDGNMCPQMFANQVSGDEDCLNMNVYTPQLPEGANSSLLPVMVYAYGGGFQSGSASSSSFGAGYLLDEDVVYVIPNVRGGLLGFLSTGDEVASGNWGLKDHVLALQWVQDNIQYFGGNPNQVTFFGESAGAGCVHLLTLSNATIGLFHRYITQSGSALGTWAHRPRAAYASRAFELGEYVGCSNDTSVGLINCLRTINTSIIMNTEALFKVWNTLPDIIWGPTDEPDIEGAVLLDSPSNLFAAGAIRDLPWIAGVVRDEGLALVNAFYNDEAMLYDFMENIDTLLPIMLSWSYESELTQATRLNATKSYYFNNYLTSTTSELLTNLTMVFGDCHFYYSTHKAVEKQYALAKNPQYFYTFNYQTESSSATSNGISHGADLFYLFPRSSTFTARDFEVVDAMVQLWTSFAINGTPTTSALNGTTWDPYSTEDKYLRIGNDSDTTLEIQYSFFKERMAFWDSIYYPVDTDNTGNTGTTEVTGATEVSWVTEVTGATGATGSSWVPESTGATEVSWVTEVTGATGATGASWVPESTGATGVSWVTEVTGATGATGSSWVPESTGVTGASWVPESTGATGASWVTEVTGATGATGASWVPESTGATGVSWITEVTGATGATEAPWVPESTGATEVSWVTEVTGATGATGASWVPESTGATGVSWVTEVTGTTGATGSSWVPESTGATGASWVPESTGTTGVSWVTEVTGTTETTEDSGTVRTCSNWLTILLVVCSKLVLTASTGDTL